MITELFILFSGYFAPCFIPPEILPYCDLEDLRIFSKGNPAGQRAFPRLLPGRRKVLPFAVHIVPLLDKSCTTTIPGSPEQKITQCRRLISGELKTRLHFVGSGSQRYLHAWRKLQLRSCILSAAAYKAKRANHGLWILIPKVCIFRRIRLAAGSVPSGSLFPPAGSFRSCPLTEKLPAPLSMPPSAASQLPASSCGSWQLLSPAH